MISTSVPGTRPISRIRLPSSPSARTEAIRAFWPTCRLRRGVRVPMTGRLPAKCFPSTTAPFTDAPKAPRRPTREADAGKYVAALYDTQNKEKKIRFPCPILKLTRAST